MWPVVNLTIILSISTNGPLPSPEKVHAIGASHNSQPPVDVSILNHVNSTQYTLVLLQQIFKIPLLLEEKRVILSREPP